MSICLFVPLVLAFVCCSCWTLLDRYYLLRALVQGPRHVVRVVVLVACLRCSRRSLVQGPPFFADVAVVVLLVACVVAVRL